MPPPPLNPISHIGRAPFPPRPPPLCTKFSTHVPHNMPHPSTVQGLATPNPRGLGAQGKAVSPPSLWPASALPGLQKELENECCHYKHTIMTVHWVKAGGPSWALTFIRCPFIPLAMSREFASLAPSFGPPWSSPSASTPPKPYQSYWEGPFPTKAPSTMHQIQHPCPPQHATPLHRAGFGHPLP